MRTLYPNASELRRDWLDPERRAEIIERLSDSGVDPDTLAEAVGKPDPFDLLCHLSYNAPLRSWRERAERLKREESDFFERFVPEARQVLDALVEKYAEHGSAQFKLPDVDQLQASVHGRRFEPGACLPIDERPRWSQSSRDREREPTLLPQFPSRPMRCLRRPTGDRSLAQARHLQTSQFICRDGRLPIVMFRATSEPHAAPEVS